MIEDVDPAAAGDQQTQVTKADAAAYIYELSKEMAGLAERQGLNRLAAALELARGLAAEALAEAAIQSRSGKAAPADAA
jgi:hypothetical protein